MKRFVNINRKDGLGAQIALFARGSEALPEKKFIVDLRFWSCFARQHPNMQHINDLFEFNTRAIVDPGRIDSINTQDIVDLGDPWEVLGTPAYGNFSQVASNVKAPYMGQSKFNPNIDVNVCDHLLLRLKNEPHVDFDITKCVAVHARLGNGEATHNGNKHDRMCVDQQKFIDRMRQFKGVDFFVCSDEQQFVEFCREEFGERIKTHPRMYPPRGCGPGHRRIGGFTKRDSVGFFDTTDPETLLHEAYVDMWLLSKCSHLIFNLSSFTLLARNTIPWKNITHIKHEE